MNRVSKTAFNLSIGWVFLLITLWQMPGTIALRNVFLFLLLMNCLVLAHAERNVLASKFPKTPIVLLATLTTWMLLVVYGGGGAHIGAFKELSSQWGVSLLCGYCGLVLASTSVESQQSARLATVIFLALLAQVILHDLMVLWFHWINGVMPYRSAPVLRLPNYLVATLANEEAVNLFEVGLMDKFSYVNNTLAAITIAELVQRFISRKRFISVNNLSLVITVGAIFLCSYSVKTRNGSVGLIVLLLTAALFLAIKLGSKIGWRLVGIAALGFCIFIFAMGSVFVKSDVRWQSLADTVPIALDTQKNLAWMRQAPYPQLPSGQTVDESNYDRVAWMKEGLMLIKDQPLGSGYVRSAFGDRVVQKYEGASALRGAHSHSGLIDFTIANGVPALILWGAFLGALTWLGWKGFQSGNAAAGLMLVFLVSGFFGRSIVDSTLRDHMLQQFMFLSMTFLVLANQKRGPTS